MQKRNRKYWVKRIIIAFILIPASVFADDVYQKTGVVFRNVLVLDTTGAFVHYLRDGERTAISIELVEKIELREYDASTKSKREIYSILKLKDFTQSQNNSGKFAVITVRTIAWKPFDAPTIGIQSLLGIGLSAGWIALAYPKNHTGSDPAGMQSGLTNVLQISVAVLGAVSIPIGIYSGGDMMGGNGAIWESIAGALIGFGIGLFVIKTDDTKDLLIPVYCIEVAGGIVGYHVSAAPIYNDLKNTPLSQQPMPDFKIKIITIHL